MTRFGKKELDDTIQDMETFVEHALSSDDSKPDHLLPDFAPLYISNESTEIPSRTIFQFSDRDLTEAVFRRHWAKGHPLLITEIGSKLKEPWTPQWFMEMYGSQECDIIECQTNQSKRTTVRGFFGNFGSYEGRQECWKLKVSCSFRCSQGTPIYIYDLMAGLAPIQ